MALQMVSDDASSLTCRANDTISAGEFVLPLSTNTDVVTSAGLSSFAVSDITVEASDGAANYPNVIGIAAEDATSGDYFTVYTEGVFIMKAGEAITPGLRIQQAEEAAHDETIYALDDTAGEDCIGRAWTGASAADAYCIVKLDV